MTLNFAELTKKARAGERLNQTDINDIVTAGPGATFALVELAAEFRRAHFRNNIEIVNLIKDGEEPAVLTDAGSEINVGNGETPEDLAAQIFDLAASEAQRITFNFLVPTDEVEAPGAAALTPMYCLRLLAATRLAAPEKSLRIATGRDVHLRSLQALALHVIDSMYMSDFRVSEPRLVFEDLKLIRSGGLVVEGAEDRDIAEEYVAYLTANGVEDAQGYATVILAEEEPGEEGGCGGGCSCGSGGCGSSTEPEEDHAHSSAGCGGGGCGCGGH